MRFLSIALQCGGILYAFHLSGKVLPDLVLGWFSSAACMFMCVYLTVWLMEITQDCILQKQVSSEKKAVLITGCDTGFGNTFAKALDKKKFKVYACCLSSTSDGAQNLRDTCSNLLQIVQLDVTDNQSVRMVKDFVAEDLNEYKLWAVVNNAGVLKGFHTELSTIQDYEACMNVNAVGMVRVTLAFLPLIRKSKGRVVNICSFAGRSCCNLMGAYDMSKSAAIAFSDVLRLEMREVGVRVISIEPEFFRTPMCSKDYLTKQLDASLESIDEAVITDYGESYIKKAKELFFTIFLNSSTNTKLVIDAVEKAVALEYPADIYKPARNSVTKILMFFAERVPWVLKFPYMMIFMFLMGVPKPKTGLNLLQRFAM